MPLVAHLAELAIEDVKIAQQHLIEALSAEAAAALDAPEDELSRQSNDRRAAVEWSLDDYARAIGRYHDALRGATFKVLVWPV